MLYIIYLFGHHRASLNLNLLGSPTSNPNSAVDCYLKFYGSEEFFNTYFRHFSRK